VTLRNDARVRDQSRNGDTSSTMRILILVGVSPLPVPDEPPLGYRIHDLTPHELEPSMASISPPVGEAQATDDPAHAPSSDGGPAPSGGLVSERAGSSPSPQQTNE
jgi:hypothetical protein